MQAGSLTTSKTQPNDVDLLVMVETNDVVPAVAAAARKLG
jgi:hypothetical protein